MSTMGNAFQKVRQAASLASKKTGNAVELSRLKLQSVQVNSMIQSTYERMGTLIYEQEKTGTDNYELIAVCIKEVDSLLVELNEINNRAHELKNGVRCACGELNPSDSTYCKSCGANLRRKRETPEPNED